MLQTTEDPGLNPGQHILEQDTLDFFELYIIYYHALHI